MKVKLPSSYLQTLPDFPTPISKSRLKRIAAEEKKATENEPTATPTKKIAKTGATSTSKVGSPAPNANAETSVNNFKINSGLKELSTSGLTMNSISSEHYLLDKSGKPTKKWVKKPHQFKTFSGFKIKYVTYRQKDQQKEKAHIKKEPAPVAVPTAVDSASETPETKVET